MVGAVGNSVALQSNGLIFHLRIFTKEGVVGCHEVTRVHLDASLGGEYVHIDVGYRAVDGGNKLRIFFVFALVTYEAVIVSAARFDLSIISGNITTDGLGGKEIKGGAVNRLKIARLLFQG